MSNPDIPDGRSALYVRAIFLVDPKDPTGPGLLQITIGPLPKEELALALSEHLQAQTAIFLGQQPGDFVNITNKGDPRGH